MHHRIVIKKAQLLSAVAQISRFQYVLLIILSGVVLLLSNHLWHGDVLFHTDLARDFLVLEDIVTTRNPTLIGPRSGGIPGVFHGPLWYYMSLVPFLISRGDPVLMGWFWWALGVGSVAVFLWVMQRMTKNFTVSLLVAIGFALSTLPQAASPVNNYMADLFGFLVFACWLWWLQKPTMLSAVLGWFGMGVLVQFQMAFAVPIAIVWFPVFVVRVLRARKYGQLPSVFIFVLPLLSFILFELRHDFLQTRSVLAYLQQGAGDKAPFFYRALQRLQSLFGDGVNVFLLPVMAAPIVIGIFSWVGWRTKCSVVRSAIGLFSVWYLGWWVLACGFSGTVWTYYFSPFFGIQFLCIGTIAAHSRHARYLLFMLVIWMLLQSRWILSYDEGRFNSSSWRLLSNIAKAGLSQPNRGYFVYSQDQFAYPLKYAFFYYNASHPEVQARAFEKRPETVLVKAADDPRNPHATAQDWQKNKIKIPEEPTERTLFPHGYVLEVYALSEETMKKPIDPNLILDLHFR